MKKTSCISSIRLFVLALTVVAVLMNWVTAYAQEAGKPLFEPQEKAALLKMDGQVDDVMVRSLKRRVFEAQKAGCSLIILDVDTYGGQVTSALEISKYIKSLKIPTAAWVHDKAYSAGTVISLACDKVVMSEQATMGDVAPISQSGTELSPDIKAKVSSPLLQDLEDSAKKHGISPMLTRAMVAREVEIYELRNINTGEKKFVDGEHKNDALKEMIKTPDGQEVRPWRVTEPPIDTEKEVLTVGPERAVEMNFASRIVSSEQQLIAAMNIRGELMPLGFSWSEQLTRWLVQWPVRMGLFILMLVLAYVELTHPGISVAGIGAVICLVLLVGAPWLSGVAQVWEIILIVAGLIIIILDLVHGGLGLLAIPGFVLLAIGMVASFIPSSGGGGWVPQMWSGLLRGLSVLVFGSAASLILVFLLAHYLEMTPGLKHIRLAPADDKIALPLEDAAEQLAEEAVFVGAIGKAVTDLRPAGKAKFGQHLMDVVSDGAFLPQGTQLKVTEVSALRVVVVADTQGELHT